MRIIVILLLSLFILPAAVAQQDQPKHIILLIGDGMGLSQVSASFYFNQDSTNFWRFPVTGLMKTSASSHKITDSAAGATAFSTGNKTYNGAIAMDRDTVPVPIITNQLAAKGFKSGIIATSSIQHATPACFYAHATYRHQYELIASQLHTSPVGFYAGGGLKFLQKRSDGCNYLDSLRNSHFEVGTTSLPKPGTMEKSKKYAYFLAEEGMPKAPERGDFLPQATQLALEYLDEAKNFFLMVEGSQIDWGGHENNADYLIGEMLDFDKTVGIALDYAEKHPETLVIVTADHETGGFTLAAGKTRENNNDYDRLAPSFSTGGHSATLIPVFAFGPGAELFTGVYENTDIYFKIMQALGFNK